MKDKDVPDLSAAKVQGKASPIAASPPPKVSAAKGAAVDVSIVDEQQLREECLAELAFA